MNLRQITGANIVAISLLAGCTVGPDFKSQEPVKIEQFTELKMEMLLDVPAEPSAGTQQLQLGADVPAQWWQLFASDKLNQLLEQGLANSFTVAAADARLKEVQENLGAQEGSALYPSIDAKVSSNRQKISGAAFGTPPRLYSVHNASVNASYTLDFFGGSSRYLEGLEAQVNYAAYQLEAARLTVASNIATAAINEASLRAQIEAVAQLIADSEAQLLMAEQQYALGAVTQRVVLTRQAALAEAKTAMPGLQQQLAQTRHLLKVLVGKLPSANDIPEFTFADLHLPSSLPLSLPSELVRQRPDILAAEALLHQASANVGVATSNLYPRLTLSASYGSESATVGDLFGAGSAVWGLGAGLLQPIFRGGELRSKKRAAEAAYDQALANYRDVVLQAFRDVADTLVALDTDRQQVGLASDSEQAAASLLALMQEQFAAGAVNRIELLNANQQYMQSKAASARAAASQLADGAALMHALGGGWWNQNKALDNNENNTAPVAASEK